MSSLEGPTFYCHLLLSYDEPAKSPFILASSYYTWHCNTGNSKGASRLMSSVGESLQPHVRHRHFRIPQAKTMNATTLSYCLSLCMLLNLKRSFL